jgi:predicted nucleotidyltransferase
MLTESDIKRIVRRIAEAHAPLVVGVFGSYVIGRARDRSDLDLFIIRETSEPRAARARAVRRLLFGVLYPLDIHVFTPREFEDSVYELQSFTWVIAQQARICHWKNEADQLVPSLSGRARKQNFLAPDHQLTIAPSQITE